jgi:hypothetical protein
MKFYGHANLQQNQLQNAVLELYSTFPVTPKTGQVAFVGSIVYICIDDSSPPIWVPLTQEISSYTHNQNSAASTWNITHNLNTTDVNIMVYDSSNRMIIPDEIEVVGPTTATVELGTEMTGKAVVIAGHITGVNRPIYAFTFYQDEEAATWTISHNLGYNPIIRVFIGVNEVQPESITHPDVNTTIVTFSTPQAGYARLI